MFKAKAEVKCDCFVKNVIHVVNMNDVADRWAGMIGGEVELPIGKIRQHIHTSPNSVWVDSEMENAVQFSPIQNEVGTSMKFKKTSGRVLIPHAWVGKTRSGHKGVFIRKTPKRYPIKLIKTGVIVNVAYDTLDEIESLIVKKIIYSIGR